MSFGSLSQTTSSTTRSKPTPVDTTCFTRAETLEIARKIAEGEECKEKLNEISSRSDTLELALGIAERRIDNLLLSNRLLETSNKDLLEVDRTREIMLRDAVRDGEKQRKLKTTFAGTTVLALILALIL